MEFNLADLFEHAVDHFGEREYLVAGGKRRTYAEMDARANRLAHHLAACGVGPGDHVGIYGLNSVEWIESLWAIFKLRAVWININYRYVEDELAYLFGNADLMSTDGIHPNAAGARLIATMQPDSDFAWTIDVAAEDMLASEGLIAFETVPVYLPGVAEGTSDGRQLGLRLFEIDVIPSSRD